MRIQREAIPQEQARLEARRASLEEENRRLRGLLAEARGERIQPEPSLPDLLTPPFRVIPSRRTGYGRMRHALRAMPAVTGWMVTLLLVTSSVFSPARVAAMLFLLAACFGVLFLLQEEPDDDAAWASWDFGEDGFTQVGQVGAPPVRYAELVKVEVTQGWLQRRYGFGNVRVVFQPSAPTSVGRALSHPNRSVELQLLDAPERLATWLQERSTHARQAAHVR
ncbi:hypothetical protein [Corallococcus sp. 4LFB]|uniref:hypothetical protein n=1 Tax=Corallococcus sp. 4LFB TaxID=3383249 RepID=UPI003975F3CD